MTRNEEIKQLRQSGKTLEEIGQQFNLTRERVRQIVDKKYKERYKAYQKAYQKKLIRKLTT